MKKKVTVKTYQEFKNEGRKITMLTAYDYTMAKLVINAGVDSILIGDSLAMTMQGHSSTLPVTVDDIIYHTKMVVQANTNALIVSDMPFLSYHVSVEDTVRNAGRIVKEGGAEAVKLEGGRNIIDQVKAIIDAQIPVMGHLGLTPQSVNAFGGFKVQGRDDENAKRILDDALALQDAGVFSIVLEGIPEKLAKEISEQLYIPTIGIGAGKHCDGQVLVLQDMLGMYDNFVPKFVKQYANLNSVITSAVQDYIKEVQDGDFPTEEYTYK
ncbi:MAG TPA: 3-methyl-2-oxobutanoate hydroxymethyltransferase [Bacteroidales bacterium]|nr:3-methyl-2-oxobutanoate hydroxymethyltransferase [Bacteroidales bacterium]